MLFCFCFFGVFYRITSYCSYEKNNLAFCSKRKETKLTHEHEDRTREDFDLCLRTVYDEQRRSQKNVQKFVIYTVCRIQKKATRLFWAVQYVD